MRKPVALITGANGEIGHGLVHALSEREDLDIVAIDLNAFSPELERRLTAGIVGDITDTSLLERLVSEYAIQEIYHLAALLSTRAEYTPHRAHQVNVEGTLNLLELAHDQASWHGTPVKFLFPSSIAAYGFPSRASKEEHGRVAETVSNFPTTMYGCNKLYCEHLGRYYTQHFRQLASDRSPVGVDFRALRFPGLISAVSLPSGGTSDYAPEMIHAAARGEPYACFVDAGASLPFMAMPDGVKALLDLAAADADALSQRVYNVTAFSLTADQIRDRVLTAFPAGDITFSPDPPRAAIVDSWPADIDDGPARRDWGWQPEYPVDRAFDEYLVPSIRQYYERSD